MRARLKWRTGLGEPWRASARAASRSFCRTLRRSRPKRVAASSSASLSSLALPSRRMMGRGERERAGSAPLLVIVEGLVMVCRPRVSSVDQRCCGMAGGRRYLSLGWYPARSRLNCCDLPPSVNLGTGPAQDWASPRPRIAPKEPHVLHQMTSPDRIRLCLTNLRSCTSALYKALVDQCCAFWAVGKVLRRCAWLRCGLLAGSER